MVYQRALTCAGLFLAMLPVLYSQTPAGSIAGIVRDPSGAVIPGATVGVTHVETGVSRSVSADSAGRYHVPGLLPGHYEVQAQASGFATELRKGIQLTVGKDVTMDFALAVGQVAQTTIVTAEAPMVEITTSTITGLVDDRTIRDLPLNGRSFDQLISLESSAPKVRNRGFSSLTGASDSFSVNGARIQSNL